MRMKSILAGLAGAALVAAPTAAIANPASSLSVASSVRSSAPAGDSELNAPGSIIGMVLFAAVIAGGIILVVQDDDDGPDSR